MAKFTFTPLSVNRLSRKAILGIAAALAVTGATGAAALLAPSNFNLLPSVSAQTVTPLATDTPTPDLTDRVAQTTLPHGETIPTSAPETDRPATPAPAPQAAVPQATAPQAPAPQAAAPRAPDATAPAAPAARQLDRLARRAPLENVATPAAPVAQRPAINAPVAPIAQRPAPSAPVARAPVSGTPVAQPQGEMIPTAGPGVIATKRHVEQTAVVPVKQTFRPRVVYVPVEICID